MPVYTGSSTTEGYEAKSSGSAFYATVRAGNAVTTATDLIPNFGQEDIGSTYEMYEGFIKLPSSVKASAQERVVFGGFAAWMDKFQSSVQTTDWDVEFRQLAWSSQTWVAGASVGANPLLVTCPAATMSLGGPGTSTILGSEALHAYVSATNLPMIVANADFVAGIPPVNDHRDAGRYYGRDSRLIYGTVTDSLLNHTQNAQVKLADGTEVWLETTGTPAAPGVKLRYRTRAGAPTDIATLGIGTGSTQWALPPGAQSISLAVDPSDNLYIVGRRGSESNTLLAQAYAKSTGLTWVAKSFFTVANPTYTGAGLNNVAATWHAANQGTLAVNLSHAQGATSYDQVLLRTLNARVLLGIVGGAHDLGYLSYVPDTDSQLRATFANPSGTGLAIATLGTTTGVLYTVRGASGTLLRTYALNSNGTIASVSSTTVASAFTTGALDPNVAARVIALPTGNFAVYRNGSWTTYNPSLTSLGSGSMPVNYTSPAWFNPRTNKMHVYFVDSGRELYRADRDVISGVATTTLVASDVTPSGSTFLKASVTSASNDDRYVLVRIAYLAGDGTTHGLIYTADTTLNVAPNAPIQASSPTTINAAIDNTLSWTFSDPNTADTQTAYQLVVYNASTGVSAYDSGKVTSAVQAHSVPAATLSNGTGYTWKVRTWDVADAAGAYSGNKALATATTGIVAITDPANDNPPGLTSSTLTVTWDFTAGSGATQAEYRVAVVRTDTSVTIYDTGFVVGSGVTSHTITGLLSDIEQRIEVTVKDTAAQTSGVGTRLVTPSFSSPKTPTITVTATGADASPGPCGPRYLPDNRIDVAVVNPASNVPPIAPTTPGGASMGSLVDSFSAGSLDTSIWDDNTGSPVVTDGTAVLPCVSTDTVMGRAASYDLTGSYAHANITAPASGNGGRYSQMAVTLDANNLLLFSIEAGDLVMRLREAGSNDDDSVTYDPIGHANLRIRESAGNVLFEASNGIGWTTLRTVAPGFALTALTLAFTSGYSGTEDPADMLVDNVNTGVLDEAESFPIPTRNDIYRRTAALGALQAGLWELIGTTEPDGTFSDYTAGSGVSYDYQASAISDAGSSASGIATGVVLFYGIWLHDPADPAATLRWFQLDEQDRTQSIDRARTELRFVGRTLPVYDFGTEETDQVKVTVVVPHGPDWSERFREIQQLPRAGKVFHYRDGRGRALYAVITDWTMKDTQHGNNVGLTFTRSDYAGV